MSSALRAQGDVRAVAGKAWKIERGWGLAVSNTPASTLSMLLFLPRLRHKVVTCTVEAKALW
eukprot:scaffold97110_cov21-Tisochrysis_lutea.AAC.1